MGAPGWLKMPTHTKCRWPKRAEANIYTHAFSISLSHQTCRVSLAFSSWLFLLMLSLVLVAAGGGGGQLFCCRVKRLYDRVLAAVAARRTDRSRAGGAAAAVDVRGRGHLVQGGDVLHAKTILIEIVLYLS